MLGGYWELVFLCNRELRDRTEQLEKRTTSGELKQPAISCIANLRVISDAYFPSARNLKVEIEGVRGLLIS